MVDTDGAIVRDTLDEIVRDRDTLGETVTDGVTDGIKIVDAKKYAHSGLCVTYVVVCEAPYV